MSDRFAAHLPPAIRNLPARTRHLTIGAAAAITIGAVVAIPALLAAPARPGNAVLAGHSGPVFSVAFSPDGKTLASGGSLDHTVRLWDLATHRQIGKPLTGHTGSVTSAAFSPDGKTLASASVDGTVRLWDVATHRQISGATTATGPPDNGTTATTNGLEKKSPADVVRAAAAALRAAKSVHIVGSALDGPFDGRLQPGPNDVGSRVGRCVW